MREVKGFEFSRVKQDIAEEEPYEIPGENEGIQWMPFFVERPNNSPNRIIVWCWRP